MNDFEKSYQIVKNAIQNNLWEERLPIIQQERLRVLDYFNFCPTVERVIKDYTTKSKNVCYIHSCTFTQHGTESLDNILSSLMKNRLYYEMDSIVINNVGTPLGLTKYKDISGKITVINSSEDPLQYELSTLRLMHAFCKKNGEKVNGEKVNGEKVNVLYLHTKGISYSKGTNIYNNVNDWIQYMLYYLVQNYKTCVKMLKEYDTVGVNYLSSPNHHWSGNYWWATSEHIASLDVDFLTKKHDAEWWCLSKENIKLFELHNSKIDHYREPYKLDQYKITTV